ncbi:MAG: aminotransferase class I/II-fold pyridoxal phosphate-dependent enzyme [Planctomycetota bacterium]|nr:aminotransferase class I/II-fold pyridoxal phosphate-dependent enzyme [Planctomycetota bacterium]
MATTNDRQTEQLALQGGMKAVSGIEGKGEPKIGAEEFMSIAERFGLSEETLAKIRDAVEAEDWGGGPFLANYYCGLPESRVQAYERTARELFGSPFAIGVSSGTGALHSAFVAAGVKPGTEVICPAIGFYATAAAVGMAGGVPVFCDVDNSMTMDADLLEPLINERTVALAPTHPMGNICHMDKIMAVAEKHGLKVVEDCAQACGGRFNGQLVGTFGEFGCFSISAYKIVGGGEGGLVLTKIQRDWDRVNGLAEGGGLWRPVRFAEPRYEDELLIGTNYRMSDLEASVNVVQLGRMEETVERFRHTKQRVVSQLESFAEITPQLRHDPAGDVGYQLRFFPDTVELAVKIAEALNAEGIGAGTRGGNERPDWHIYHYMYPLKDYAGCSCYDGDASKTYDKGACPVADDLFERVVSIGLNQWYTEGDCDQIAAGINKVLRAYCTPASDGKPW